MFRRIAILTIATLALVSCSKDDHEPAPEPTRVLLVYVGTDNNLAGYEQEKLQALRDGWTGRPTDHIVVYRDTRGAPARLMEISNLAPGEQPRELATYGTENSASPQILTRVINEVVGLYPADSYGLLVFSHASGWLPEGAFDELSRGIVPSTLHARGRSVIVDGSDEMELADFAAAIPDGVFDYIVLEACFTAGIEVAYQLRGKAPYILASSAEIVHPGFAPVYAQATKKLFTENLAGFGQDAFDHTLTYAESNPQRSATLSVIRTAGLDALADFVRENCDFSREVDAADIQRFDRLNVGHVFFDFGDYYSRLLDTDAQRAQLDRLIADCVSWKASTQEFMTQQPGYNGFPISSHCGLTTYIPQLRFGGLNTAYTELMWTQTIDPI